MLAVTMCVVAILALSTTANAQAPRPPATGLEAVVGVYQGTIDARRGKAPIACELRLANGTVTGTLQPGDDALAVTGASLAGNTLTLNLDINGNDVPLTGTFKDGHFEGSVMGATLVMTKVDPHAAAVSAPSPNASESDKAAVKQAAYDYAEGGFEGAADRMERAVHPALVKRGLVPFGRAFVLSPMNAEMLIEGARAGGGRDVPADQRNISFEALDIRDNVATARIFTSQFNDYLHLVKMDGKWRLANVLWQPPSQQGVANVEADKAAIAQVFTAYFDAIRAGDAAAFERLIHPDAALRSFKSAPSTRWVIAENNRESDVERVRQKRMPIAIVPTVTVLDVYDNIASVLLTSASNIRYCHLARQNGRWRIVNMLSR
jgi:hypothetical protein